jgi:hypothetical protein
MRAVTLVAAALGLAAACGTHIIDLSVPKDSTMLSSAAGGAGGDLLPKGGGPLGTAADGGSPSTDGGSPETACEVVPTADSRCLVCPSSTSGLSMVCLTCQPPVQVDVSGAYCRTCAWADIKGQCLQCFSADGTATQDDCDGLRTSASAP